MDITLAQAAAQAREAFATVYRDQEKAQRATQEAQRAAQKAAEFGKQTTTR